MQTLHMLNYLETKKVRYNFPLKVTIGTLRALGTLALC